MRIRARGDVFYCSVLGCASAECGLVIVDLKRETKWLAVEALGEDKRADALLELLVKVGVKDGYGTHALRRLGGWPAVDIDDFWAFWGKMRSEEWVSEGDLPSSGENRMADTVMN